MTTQPTSAEGARPSVLGMATGWWAPGLALHERVAGSARLAGPAPGDQRARDRLAAWRAGYGPDGAGRFAERLADTGLDEQVLLALLAESPDSLAARTARPRWARAAELAVAAAVAPAGIADVPKDWREAFALPLRPLVDAARERLTAELAGLAHIDLPAVAATFTASLRARLVTMAARTFVTELGVQRAAGLLAGADSGQRFAHFVQRLAGPAGLAGLFTRYPVLARLLGQASDQAGDALLELLTRFSADRAAIVATLLGGVDPGPLTSVEGRADRHAGGRAVAIVAFAGGQRVVYRPRDVGSHVRLGALVGWLNRRAPELGLRTITTLARDGYGWLEFIPARPLDDLAGAERFYRRQGALLALLHALHAGDMHYENLVACGDQPVLVDVETLFHADLPMAGQPTDSASATLAASVHRTALLPMIVVGEHGTADLSGLGGDRGAALPSGVADWEFPATDRMRLTRRAGEFGGAQNRPRLDGRDLDPGEHEAALVHGFRLGYDAILRHAGEFTALLESCADLDVRLVARPTRGYSTLLDESTHPDLLRDALDRDRVFDVLWTEAAGHPLRWRLSHHELADLWAGDVPLFTTRPGSRDVWTSGGQRLAGLLDRGGLTHALDKVAAMSEVDRRDQEWIISATLATRRPAAGHHSAEPVPGPVTGTAAHAERLLAAACAVADQIVARGMTDGDRVSWLGLEFVDDRQWLVLPMGASLANGYLGVALFLAQLSELSGIHRYGEVARHALGPLPGLLDLVTGRPEMVALIGSGALHGFGGIAYALARLSTLLDDAELRGWARVTAALAARADPTGSADWATGSSGCLAALSAVRAELDDAAVDGLTRSCADRLAGRADVAEGAAFAFGAAGTGWALARFAAASGGTRHAAAARVALARAAAAPEDGAHSWCSGLAGLVIARASGLADVATLEPVVGRLAGRPVLRDLSLCHGELGIAEALTVLATRVPAAAVACRRRAGLVLDALERYGPTCGTPGAVSTPGLISGLAGIGYGLLRLGFADRVPSVLLLEPAKESGP